MCQYRYYYYGGCQHQETVLYTLCPHAAVGAERSPSPSPSPSEQEEGADEGTPSATTTELATPTPQHSPSTSLPSSDSNPSVSKSLTSLSEPPQDITSIFQHQSYLQHVFILSPTRQAEHNMSALAAFSGMHIRGLLAGKPKQVASPGNMTAGHEARILEEGQRAPVGHPQHKHSGSRQRGDGSWELLTSNGSSEGSSIEGYAVPQNTEASGRGETLVVSPTADIYDSLSSEIEKLQNEVNQLRREEFEVQRTMPQSPYGGSKRGPSSSVSPRGSASVRSKIPAPLQRTTTAVSQCTRKNERAESASNSDHVGQQSTKCSPVSQSGELSKGSPHFAQPTVAAVIRRETVRRDSAIYQESATPDGSPTKSTRSAGRRQLKRAPLPGGWTDSADQQHAAASTAEAFAAGTTLDDPDTQQDAEQHTDRAIVKSERRLRKKSSTSYMSPTTATTLRNIATIGQESTKRTSLRLSRAGPLSEINTTISPVKEPKTAESIVSDSGSETIITEMNTNRTPSRPLSTHAARYMPFGNKTPTGIIPSDLRRRMTVGVSVADVLAQHARSSALPTVENTTRKRRESTGDLLNPIRARLSKVGLLSGRIAKGEVTGSSPVPVARQQLQQRSPEAPEKAVEPPKSITEIKPAFQPPHRRLWAAQALEATRAAPSASIAVHDHPGPRPSLRAIAAEFTPMSKARMPRHTFTTPSHVVHDWASALKFRTAEEWACLSPDDKRLVQAARHFRRTGGEVPVGRIASQGEWQTLMTQYMTTQARPSMSYADVYSTDVVADQKLRPFQVAGMNGLQETVQDTNGEDVPTRFNDYSPSPMPRLNSISPHRMPMFPPNSWTIGADANNQKTFGWTGGAGREIKFVGYGPDAERDPNTPVSFNFRGGNSRSCSTNRNDIGPRMIGEGSFDGTPQPPLAPRSKAQWAKLKEYTKIPCRDVDITHAVELLPVPGPQLLAGYCNDCAFSSY